MRTLAETTGARIRIETDPLQAVAGAFDGHDTASGLVQAARHGRPWLWSAPLGLALGVVGWRAPAGRRQGALLLGGALLGLSGVLGAAFAIGARGWSFAGATSLFGELTAGQPGIGVGVAVLLGLFGVLNLYVKRKKVK